MPPARQYHSPLREGRAAETRQAILHAAARVFAETGFAAATIKAIADEARVSAATVYATFGSKAQLIVSLLEIDAGPPTTKPDPDTWVAYHARMMSVSRHIIRVAIQATGEPGVAALFAAGDRNRRASLDIAFADQPAGARDQLWAITAPTVYLALVDICGWSDGDYQRWLTSMTTLVVTSATGPLGPSS